MQTFSITLLLRFAPCSDRFPGVVASDNKGRPTKISWWPRKIERMIADSH